MANHRLSSYTIFTELNADSDGKYLLTHGYTGAIDVASKDIVDYLRSGTDLDPKKAPFSDKTFQNLSARGYITDKSEEEEHDFVRRMAEAFHKRSKLFKGFMFVVTYNCNFRCPYCYESGISKDGRHWTKQVFTKELVDRAYAAMEEIEPVREFRGKKITLYGGEPLLAENREIVEYIVSQGKERGYTFGAITNGYDLEAYLDLLNPETITQLQITVDGRKEWHDRRRIHYKTGKSFDKIMENIGKALENGVHIAIRINTDANNFESLAELKELFTSQGYTAYKNFSFHSARLFGDDEELTGNETKSATPKRNMNFFTPKEFNEKHKESGLGIACQDNGIFNKLYSAMGKKTSISFNSVYCGVQAGAYIFDPYGDIYGCWETIGKKEYLLGSFGNDKVEWLDQMDAWRNRNIGNTPQCSKCKYAFICCGGCTAKLLRHENGVLEANCSQFPEVFAISANKAYTSYLANKDKIDARNNPPAKQ